MHSVRHSENRGSAITAKMNHYLHLMRVYDRFALALTLAEGAKCNNRKQKLSCENKKMMTEVLLDWLINKQVIINTDRQFEKDDHQKRL